MVSVLISSTGPSLWATSARFQLYGRQLSFEMPLGRRRTKRFYTDRGLQAVQLRTTFSLQQAALRM